MRQHRATELSVLPEYQGEGSIRGKQTGRILNKIFRTAGRDRVIKIRREEAGG